MHYSENMKTCSRCSDSKPITEFNKKSKTKISPYCRECSREIGRAHYHKNRAENSRRANERRRQRMGDIKAYIRDLKERTPCMDCDGSFPWFVMDFDHVNGKKSSEISLMVKNGMAKWRILSEITKCQIVCANCHRIRTFERAGLAPEQELE